MSHKSWFRIASALAGISVIMLAMAAHWLENHLSPEKIKSLETGAELQFMHAIAILVLSNVKTDEITRQRNRNLWIMLCGISLFSGSIYLLSLRNLINFEAASLLWPVTPLGGLMLIASWFLLVFEKK
jgi:uncharacterized membrane protein YgdD (TMEM256/DUF423 family)